MRLRIVNPSLKEVGSNLLVKLSDQFVCEVTAICNDKKSVYVGVTGIEPVLPSLAYGFLSTVSPGKSYFNHREFL